MKRIVSLVMTLTLMLTVFALPVFAETPDTSEEVTLTMYLLGDRTPDFDMVFDKINEKMKDKINATLQVKFLSWGEYEEKYPLLFAAGDDFDIIYSADWAFYNSQSTKQGFWEITDEALKTYAPMTAESIFPEAWEAAKVNGKVYMLPQNYKEMSGYIYMVRGDLMKSTALKTSRALTIWKNTGQPLLKMKSS